MTISVSIATNNLINMQINIWVQIIKLQHINIRREDKKLTHQKAHVKLHRKDSTKSIKKLKNTTKCIEESHRSTAKKLLSLLVCTAFTTTARLLVSSAIFAIRYWKCEFQNLQINSARSESKLSMKNRGVEQFANILSEALSFWWPFFFGGRRQDFNILCLGT